MKKQQQLEELDRSWADAVKDFKATNNIKEKAKQMKLPKLMDISAAKRLLPPGASVFESTTEMRCRGFLTWNDSRLSTSASMTKLGNEAALYHCLRWCWTEWCSRTGEECPVKGLLHS